MKEILDKLFQHATLSHDEARGLMGDIMGGRFTDAQLAALMTVFRMRSVTAEELTGFREALLATRVPVDLSEFQPIDIVGTGGDGKNTFNISTCACFVVAGAGYHVAKHGNYGASSVSGASNVMEAHGVRFTNDTDSLRRSMEGCGMAYLHAPLFNPAMWTVSGVRRDLEVSDTGIIAEFKRRSPSKGWIREAANAEQIAAGYVHAGASALSVLTDTPYFGGSLSDLRRVRARVDVPLLRKDFIIDPYQVWQSKAVGADVILLIAAALTPEECRSLALLAHELRMEVLLELHDEQELGHVCDEADMVGINNRCLGTFVTDPEHSFRMAEQLPRDHVLVSESGLSRPETVRRLRAAGYRGFLMGEAFMSAPAPDVALSDFIRDLRHDSEGVRHA